MIRLSDAVLLAFTKFRARKVRMIVTILLASLLFGVLIAASLIVTGGFRSAENFRADGLTSRYIVRVTPVIDRDVLPQTLRDPELVREAKSRYEQLVEEKSAVAKRLGITYTQASDQPPYMQSSDGKTEMLSVSDRNGITRALLQQKFANDPAFDDKKLDVVAEQYHAKDVFASTHYTVLRGSTLEAFADGKEVFYDQSDEAEMNANYRRSLLDGASITLAPPEITGPFLLPQNAGWEPDGESLPIILPQNIVEQLLDMKIPADTASTQEKLAHLTQLRERAVSLTFQACYRNNASAALIQQVIGQQKEMKANQNNRDYKQPSLIYELPDPAHCENPRVTSDVRNAEEKTRNENQTLFDKRFNNITEPTSRFITFKVVGISPAQSEVVGQSAPDSQAGSVGEVIGNLLETSGIGQVVPQHLYSRLSEKDKISYADIFTYTPNYLFGNEDNKERFVEFANARDATKFINEQGCVTQMDGSCAPANRPYQLSFAFTSSAALEDIREVVTQWLFYAILGVIILAAIIMWIAIGRTIADGRHETAIFRAIGFKRGDIVTVYTVYTAILTLLVAIVASILGTLGAYVVDRRFSGELTAQAQYGFGGLDMTKQVNLVGIDHEQLMLILAACAVTGFISMIAPLLRNVRRNPIHDMREE